MLGEMKTAGSVEFQYGPFIRNLGVLTNLLDTESKVLSLVSAISFDSSSAKGDNKFNLIL